VHYLGMAYCGADERCCLLRPLPDRRERGAIRVAATAPNAFDMALIDRRILLF